MNYLDYWSLLRKPFRGGEDSAFFAGPVQREAIAGLSYFASSPSKIACLATFRGCGMTRLMCHVQGMRGFGNCAVEIAVTDGRCFDRSAAESSFCEALGLSGMHREAAGEIDRALSATASQGIETLWLIDRCTTATAGVARELVAEHANLSVVIGTAGESFSEYRLVDDPHLMQIELPPLALDDVAAYVHHGLAHAGNTSRLFRDDAVVRMHEISGGVLAELSPLAESALALAASHRMDEVTPAVIEAVGQQVSRAA